ncbi:MerR family transcriptional regulator [Ostreiculturibacter nitratireducens]|uniref:MerR family transcriptional regulator n=1 Tax=Ostreiculturibacter nitratireducens TaxID=3075226 RepID=UPI0031B5AE31
MVQKDGAQKSAEAFRTISEVSELIDTPAHVLRFWESRFPQVKPIKRAGGRRYYRPADISLLDGIRKLLHEDGITIRGVQKILKEKGARYVADLSQIEETLAAEAEEAPEREPAEAAVEARASAPEAPAEAASPSELSPPVEEESLAPEPAVAEPAGVSSAAPTKEPETAADVPAPVPESVTASPEAPLSVRLRAIPVPVLMTRQSDLEPLHKRLNALHARLVAAQSRAGD